MYFPTDPDIRSHVSFAFFQYSCWVPHLPPTHLPTLPWTTSFLQNYFWSRAPFAIIRLVWCDHCPAWLLMKNEWTVHSQLSLPPRAQPGLGGATNGEISACGPQSMALWKWTFYSPKQGPPWYHTSTGGVPFNFLKQQSAKSVGSKIIKRCQV